MTDERISCILATGNRNRFFPQALRCFQAQTWKHRELVVVDDGERSVAPLCRGIENVKHIRLDRRTRLGTKLNIGIESASGSLIQKLDDDDYYAPAFLETGARRLLSSRSKQAVAGWSSFLIMMAGSTTLYSSGPGWMAGGTLSFRRAVWDKTPFRDVSKNEDHYFLEDHAGPVVRVNAPELYVLVRHGANTWKTYGNGMRVDPFLRTFDVYPRSIADLTADEASARFYSRLKRTLPK
jgi:glycosyltransferase involved in cell wall biosynthesis